jgi:hypothetical protein
VSTRKLHVIGSGHETRFGEDFDARLTAAIAAAHNPARAVTELDELVMLDVLAHYAAAGPYHPDTPPPAGPGWGLEASAVDPRLRIHRYVIHYTALIVDIVAFHGVTITAHQSVITMATIETIHT